MAYITLAQGENDNVFVRGASLDALKEAKAFALGCPAMGADVLEESDN